MVRSTLRRWWPGASGRARARGVRPELDLPFDMFDEVRTAAELANASKLAGIYHKGQRLAWSGHEVFDELLERHGGIALAPAERGALAGLFAVILWGELAAWKVSAELALRLEPLEAKLAATAQAHDEARHFYVMHEYLCRLDARPPPLGPRATRVLRGTLRADTLTKKLIGMQLMVEPMALALFHLVRRSRVEPVLCDLVALYERDEARHVALGVLHLPRLLTAMTRAEALDLCWWEFQEYWAQLEMLRELQPHFDVLGIDVHEVIRIGRQKQVRANQLLVEQVGESLPFLDVLLRVFDAKLAWTWPRDADATVRERLAAAWAAMGHALADDAPVPLTDVP